jgi:hypothetical protein
MRTASFCAGAITVPPELGLLREFAFQPPGVVYYHLQGGSAIVPRIAAARIAPLAGLILSQNRGLSN